MFVVPTVKGAAQSSSERTKLKATGGFDNMNEAKDIIERAQKYHERALGQLIADWEATQELAEAYDQLQIDVKLRTVGRFGTFIKRMSQRGTDRDMKFLTKLQGISIQQIEEYEAAAMEAKQFVKGTIAHGIAAGQSLRDLFRLFGTASVGTAIAKLSSARAWNGMRSKTNASIAVDTFVLGDITVGPALAIGGSVLASQGKEAMTEALRYEAKVNSEVAKIKVAIDYIQRVKRRTAELKGLVEYLNACVLRHFHDLEPYLASGEGNSTSLVDVMPTADNGQNPDSQTLTGNEVLNKFQQVALRVKALAEIIKQPILDSQGQLNPATDAIRAKYCAL